MEKHNYGPVTSEILKYHEMGHGPAKIVQILSYNNILTKKGMPVTYNQVITRLYELKKSNKDLLYVVPNLSVYINDKRARQAKINERIIDMLTSGVILPNLIANKLNEEGLKDTKDRLISADWVINCIRSLQKAGKIKKVWVRS